MYSKLASFLALAPRAFRKGSLAFCVGSMGLVTSSHAGAEEARVSSTPEPARHLTWQPAPSETQAAGSIPPAAQRPRGEQRPFAFLLDPSTPAARDVGLTYDLGAGSAVSAERPLPSSLGVAGVTHAFTVDYGWGAHVAPFASLRVVQSTNSRTEGGLGASGGVRWQLTDVDADFRLTLAAAVFREVEGTVGSYARVAASYDLGRLRLATNVHAEKAFASGRDSVDVLLLAGASYRLFDEMRIGVEYVGQDLEEALDDEGGAEGGAKHYVGPSLALNLLSDRLLLVAGTGINLATPDSGVMGRVGTLMVF